MKNLKIITFAVFILLALALGALFVIKNKQRACGYYGPSGEHLD